MRPDEARCPSDEALLALVEGRLDGDALAALDAHLDACGACREVVAALGQGPGDGAAASRSGPRPTEASVRRAEAVGRFLVLEPIGRGAMGTVHAAYDPQLERKVALKLLHGDGGERARARLLREAQAMARLSHPNVVTVYDVGTRGDDVYVAMELVGGANMRQWLSEERSRPQILRAFSLAGEGLAAAHEAGLVHRDFKPENVLLDARGVPKVGDFGLATASEPGEVLASGPAAAKDAGASPQLTRTGALLGTPAYMAPEQLGGDRADARSDQFAFSVALWEALTGTRPFDGGSVEELREAIEAGPPAAALGMDARTAAALRRGLAPRAEDRFADVRALLEALQPKRGARPGAAAILAGVAAASIASAGALYATSGTEVPDPCAASAAAIDGVWNDAARRGLGRAAVEAAGEWTARWTRARVAACEATHVAHEQSPDRLDRRMGCLDRQRAALQVVLAEVREADDARAIDAIETLPDPGRCAIDAAVAPPAEEIAQAVVGLRRRIDAARVQVALAEHERALTETARLVGEATQLGYQPTRAEASLVRAAALRAVARFDEADEAAEAGVLAATAAGDDRGAAEGWLARARVAGARGRISVAAARVRHARAALRRMGDPQDLHEELLHVRGVVRTNLGELSAAEEDLRQALRSAQARFGERSPRLAALHTSLGNLLRVDARYEEALAAHERALRLERMAYGEAHPRVGRHLHNLAGVLRRMGRADEAQARYERALQIKRAALGDQHPEVALTRNSLGLMARERDDLDEARRQWERAVRIFDAHQHGDAALTRFNLALVDVEQGRWRAGLHNARLAIELDSERVGPRSKRVASEHVLLARALHGAGRREEARHAVALASSIAEEIGDPELAAEAREAVELAGGERSERPDAQRAGRTLRDPRRRTAANGTGSPNLPRPEARRPGQGPTGGRTPDGDDDGGGARRGRVDGWRPAGSGSYGASQAWE